jgi:hypothetical protein
MTELLPFIDRQPDYAGGDTVGGILPEEHTPLRETTIFYHIGGQYDYGQFNPDLFAGVDLGPTDFGDRYNKTGIDGFDEAIATCERGPEVDFIIPLGVSLGQTALFGPKTEWSGTLLGPIGEIHKSDKSKKTETVQVIGVVLTVSRRGSSVPVAVAREFSLGPHGNAELPTPWVLFHEMNRADVREWNSSDTRNPHSSAARLTALFPPLGKGNSNMGSRL